MRDEQEIGGIKPEDIRAFIREFAQTMNLSIFDETLSQYNPEVHRAIYLLTAPTLEEKQDISPQKIFDILKAHPTEENRGDYKALRLALLKMPYMTEIREQLIPTCKTLEMKLALLEHEKDPERIANMESEISFMDIYHLLNKCKATKEAPLSNDVLKYLMENFSGRLDGLHYLFIRRDMDIADYLVKIDGGEFRTHHHLTEREIENLLQNPHIDKQLTEKIALMEGYVASTFFEDLPNRFMNELFMSAIDAIIDEDTPYQDRADALTICRQAIETQKLTHESLMAFVDMYNGNLYTGILKKSIKPVYDTLVITTDDPYVWNKAQSEASFNNNYFRVSLPGTYDEMFAGFLKAPLIKSQPYSALTKGEQLALKTYAKMAYLSTSTTAIENVNMLMKYGVQEIDLSLLANPSLGDEHRKCLLKKYKKDKSTLQFSGIVAALKNEIGHETMATLTTLVCPATKCDCENKDMDISQEQLAKILCAWEEIEHKHISPFRTSSLRPAAERAIKRKFKEELHNKIKDTFYCAPQEHGFIDTCTNGTAMPEKILNVWALSAQKKENPQAYYDKIRALPKTTLAEIVNDTRLMLFYAPDKYKMYSVLSQTVSIWKDIKDIILEKEDPSLEKKLVLGPDGREDDIR